MLGHALVASRRAESYPAEVSLSGEYKELLERSRADGFDPEKNQLEEVKSFKRNLDTLPENHRNCIGHRSNNMAGCSAGHWGLPTYASPSFILISPPKRKRVSAPYPARIR